MLPYKLYAGKEGGSMIVELAFALTGAPVEIIDVPWEDTGWQSKILAPLNPLGQVPTLILPDGEVMTESAAMILHLNDRFPEVGLAPAPDHPTRPRFLRTLLFLVSAIYPTFTYGDVTSRWVGEDEKTGAGKALRESTHEHRKVLYEHLETQAASPFFLGEAMSAIDLYLWAMVRWRPGRKWHAERCPKLTAIAARVGELPEAGAVEERNRSDG